MKKHAYVILAVIFSSFFALGMPDGAFGVAWPGIRSDLGQPLQRAGVLLIIQFFFHALTSSHLGFISRYIKLEKMGVIGMALMTLGFFAVSLAPNFTALALVFVPVGIGMGLTDSSLSTYAVKSFTARQLNWLFCSWGLGASIAPVVMVQIIMASSWRVGYASIAAVQGAIVLIVVASFLKGFWVKREKLDEASQQHVLPKIYLTKNLHKIMAVACCFLYGSIEYSLGVWVTSVLMESRGMELRLVGIYPAIYYACITGGRLIFGFWANKFTDTSIIRFGFCMSLVGLIILFATSSILGMALIGLGFAPIFPCLMHESGKRFNPKILTKLVGFQIAALGAGVAILASLIGLILSRVSLEALFPIVMVLIVMTLLINESLEKTMSGLNEPRKHHKGLKEEWPHAAIGRKGKTKNEA